ncbi:MAG: Nramp family divalent metal transporter [Chloroflexi bacterium]|nr:Nramp family divalent metal transporter [Chloroflexota bacterium]
MATEVNTLAGAGRQSAVLDTAHLGDIRGALGTVRQHDIAPRYSWRARLLTLLAIMGPGLIVMVGDNDAGGVATYAQAGQNYGTTLLWTLLLLIPVLIVNQEMCVRLGAVTGVGHARLILERFGRFWGAFSVGDLFILNFLTLVTEFIGVSLAMSYFGVSPLLSVPVAALALIAVTVTGSFRRWERFMYVFMAFNLLAIPLALVVHPDWGQVLHDTFVPGVQGGVDSTALLLIVGIVGTTVAPWQLFFQQSNVVDKRITHRWLNYERWDTFLGSIVTEIGAAALLIAAAFGLAGTEFAGQFTDAGGVATALAQTVGPVAGNLFAVFLLDAAIIGAAAVTLATSYAFGDVFGIKHSLHRGVGDARGFYAIYAGLVVLAAGIVLIPNAPLGLLTLAVQALAGVLLPSATVFLLLLCNDREVLGPWTNPRWLNVVASVIVGVLVMLSLILVVRTLFPDLDGTLVASMLGGATLIGLLVIGAFELRGARHTGPSPAMDRDTWRMPPLATLHRPVWSTTRKVGMLVLRGYLLIAALLLIVKVVQLALGQPG